LYQKCIKTFNALKHQVRFSVLNTNTQKVRCWRSNIHNDKVTKQKELKP
jgi:hypothetical protein